MSSVNDNIPVVLKLYNEAATVPVSYIAENDSSRSCSYGIHWDNVIRINSMLYYVSSQYIGATGVTFFDAT